MSQEIRWDKLDNTANLFPVIAGESMSNVYRISVTLTELVDHELFRKLWILSYRSLMGLIFVCKKAFSGIILRKMAILLLK